MAVRSGDKGREGLGQEQFDYPHRTYGMDHERYEWSQLIDRKPVVWPDGKKLALWVNVGLQFYPLNQDGRPFKVPGGMTMPYPDLRHYSLRDYGNRVGIYRFFKAFDEFDVKPTIAVSTRLAQRYPYLINKIKERGDEIVCHGYHQDALHYGGQDESEEAALVKKALDGLREITETPVTGWISPAKNESHNTPDLLAANGIEYFCDWVNDDMPYSFKTKNGDLTAMPLPTPSPRVLLTARRWASRPWPRMPMRRMMSAIAWRTMPVAALPSTAPPVSSPLPTTASSTSRRRRLTR